MASASCPVQLIGARLAQPAGASTRLASAGPSLSPSASVSLAPRVASGGARHRRLEASTWLAGTGVESFFGSIHFHQAQVGHGPSGRSRQAASRTPPVSASSDFDEMVADRTRKYFMVGGKGGVGKTSVSAALAVKFANEGHRTLVVSTDPAHSLSDSFAQRLSVRAASTGSNGGAAAAAGSGGGVGSIPLRGGGASRGVKQVLLVDPVEAKRLAQEDLKRRAEAARRQRWREIEATNGAWAVIGVTAAVVGEGVVGVGPLGQVALYLEFVAGLVETLANVVSSL